MVLDSMFYHFCILHLVSEEAADPTHYTGNIQTRKICREAAQSILGLAATNTSESVVGSNNPKRGLREYPGGLASRFVYAAESFLALPFFLHEEAASSSNNFVAANN
jgi:hypothetical protein